MSFNLKVIKNLVPQIPKQMRGKVADILNRAALGTEGDAKQLAPVDTGFLRNSIQANPSATAGRLKSETNVAAEYGINVELGTVKMAAQPYLSPAFETNRTDALSQLKKVLK